MKNYHIELLEFYEMIGRVAEIAIVEDTWPLHRKIEKVLNEWLPLVGL